MGRNNLIYLCFAAIALIGLFYILKPKSDNPANNFSAITSTESTTSSSTLIDSNVKSFNLVVKNKKLVSGSVTLKVNEGDRVTINITSDEPEEFHLHGYDKSVEMEASKSAQLIS